MSLQRLSVETKLNVDSCCIDDSHRSRLQEQGKPRLSGCWLDPSNLMVEVCLLHTRVTIIGTHTYTHADINSVLGNIPVLSISYKPQFISPKFQVSLII